MRHDPIWHAFTVTGHPLYYLLYKAVPTRRNQT